MISKNKIKINQYNLHELVYKAMKTIKDKEKTIKSKTIDKLQDDNI